MLQYWILIKILFYFLFSGLKEETQDGGGDLTEYDTFELNEITEEIRIVEERIARFLSLKNPSSHQIKSPKKSTKEKKVTPLEAGNVVTPEQPMAGASSVNFGALPRKIAGRKCSVQLQK